MTIRSAITVTLTAALLLGAAPVVAEEINCEGVFHENATLAEIEAAFGKDNVVTGEVPGPEGTTMIATTIYPDDPARTMQVRWWDEADVEYLAGVTLAEGDSGPGGVKVEMPIEEVEAINGEPFNLFGFYWDYGGFAGFESGKLSGLPGGCVLNLRFSPTREDLPTDVMNAISGDIELKSDMPEMLEAKVTVYEVNLGYAYPEELEEGGEDAVADVTSLVGLAPEAIAALVDLRSFPNSTGPRREDHLRTFADYGFTEVTVADGTVELHQPDGSWMVAVTPLETTEDRAILCILDRALGGPTYHSQDPTAFALGEEGLLVATDETLEDTRCPHIGE